MLNFFGTTVGRKCKFENISKMYNNTEKLFITMAIINK